MKGLGETVNACAYTILILLSDVEFCFDCFLFSLGEKMTFENSHYTKTKKFRFSSNTNKGMDFGLFADSN